MVGADPWNWGDERGARVFGSGPKLVVAEGQGRMPDVDPEFRTLEVFARGSDGLYVHALSAESGVVGDLPGFEGLSLDLDALWHKGDDSA